MTIQTEILDGHQISTGRRKPSDLVAEYDAKLEAISAALEAFSEAGKDLVRACTIGGAYPGLDLRTGSVGEHEARRALLQSAWRNVWGLYGLDAIASADTKRRVERMFEAPPPFTVENIRDQFGDLVSDPWGSVLRGLAEVFSSLDPAFKSHEKMKIGVKGLPKRVILSGMNSYHGYGHDKLRDILNALAAYQRKPIIEYDEIVRLKEGGDLLNSWSAKDFRGVEKSYPPRGVRLVKYQNGNGHLYFDPDTLRDVNRALAEYYGDVLPDCPEERPANARSTAVSRDLQFYPTPPDAVDRLLDNYNWRGKRVLEPSCGDGAILDKLRGLGATPFGIEVDAGRATQCRAKGHYVLRANFLDQPATGDFDAVAMNPPFYGRHYAQHVRHALKFLRKGGVLFAILPATARYDHHELDDLRPQWSELPVGSFSASGTNINTVIARITA
ncbi:DUF4942 domain-containing protein [Paenirhodobacter enshiensis]|uniref:DUF4942 domain-containing protein n=1 Tax=Paenirhodobacter enshiensis TaxID=1105367 RepID=UPI0035B3EBFC